MNQSSEAKGNTTQTFFGDVVSDQQSDGQCVVGQSMLVLRWTFYSTIRRK